MELRLAGRIENLKPWKPGQSGNPKGRPKQKSIETVMREILREEFVGPDGETTTKLEVLARVMWDKVIRDRDIATINLLLKRLWPEVRQHEVSGSVSLEQQIQDAARELDKILGIDQEEKRPGDDDSPLQ